VRFLQTCIAEINGVCNKDGGGGGENIKALLQFSLCKNSKKMKKIAGKQFTNSRQFATSADAESVIVVVGSRAAAKSAKRMVNASEKLSSALGNKQYTGATVEEMETRDFGETICF
jgi:hypothetical protein